VTTTLIKLAWVPETFRKMRHSWKLFADYLEAQNMTYADILKPKAKAIAANFKAHAEASGVRGLEAVFSHTNVIMDVFREGSSTLDTLIGRATRRKHPKRARKYSTMWDIQVLLRYVGDSLPDNECLSTSDLLKKALLLTMVYSASRITELTKLTIDPAEARDTVIRLNTNTKTRLEELRWITIYPVKDKTICPHAAVWELLQRRPKPATHLFVDPVTQHPLTVGAVSAILRTLMSKAGVDKCYAPYSIKHAVITYLFNLHVDEALINEFGRWSFSSRVAYAHYRVPTRDKDWLGFSIADGRATR
jgi:site-specific recombinase XerD